MKTFSFLFLQSKCIFVKTRPNSTTLNVLIFNLNISNCFYQFANFVFSIRSCLVFERCCDLWETVVLFILLLINKNLSKDGRKIEISERVGSAWITRVWSLSSWKVSGRHHGFSGPKTVWGAPKRRLRGNRNHLFKTFKW